MFMPISRGKPGDAPDPAFVPPPAARAVPLVAARNRAAATRIAFSMRASSRGTTVFLLPGRCADRTTAHRATVSVFDVFIAVPLPRPVCRDRACQEESHDERRLCDRPDLQPTGDDPGGDRERAAADFH